MHTQHAIATKKKAGGVVTAVFSDMLDRGVWVVVGAWGCARGGRDPDDGFLVLDCVAAAQKIDNVLDSIFRALISCIQVFQIPVDGGSADY